jgi:AsmA protein
MKIWIKRAAIALGALFALALLAALLFAATFDANLYKALAIDWMRTERQRTLAIDGPVDLSVFPRLAVKVSKLHLSERGRSDEFASIDQASLSLQWLPLLRKQLVVDRVNARGVRALVIRNAQGARNIDDLFGQSSEPATASRGPVMRFEVGAVRLDDSRVTLRDELTQVSGTVTMDSFSSGRLASGRETPVEFRTTLSLEQPQALRLTFDGRTALTFDTASGGASLHGTSVKVGGDTDALKAIDATLAGTLGWDGGALTAGPINIKLAAAKAAGLTLGTSTLAAQRLVYSPVTQKLELGALKLALAGKQGDSAFEATLDWPQLAITGNQLQGSGFSGRVRLDGKTALAGRFESGAPSGNFDALRLPAVALKLDGSSGPRKIDARLKSNLLLRPGRSSGAFERIELHADITEPGLQPLALTVSGDAGLDPRGAQWSLQGALSSNRFESNGSATFGATVPTVQANARFDRLDLNQVLAPTARAASAPAAAAPADTPVSMDGLTALNGRFNVSAGRLLYRQYEVADAKLDAGLDAGTLRVTRLAGKAWGGSVDGSGSAEAKAKRISIKLVANGVDANAMLKDVAGKDLISGTGRISADVTSSGASLSALRSNLAGAAALQLRDGAIKGVNLARTLRQAKAALSMKQDAITKASATEQTDFSELSASARIEDGVARSDDLDLKSPFLRIGGSGRFDIGQGRIDYTARATVAPNATGQDGAELAALRGVTVPVQLIGPFDAIDWKIQWSGVAAAVVEDRLKEKLIEKLGLDKAATPAASGATSTPDERSRRPEDQLKDKLRGLFGK